MLPGTPPPQTEPTHAPAHPPHTTPTALTTLDDLLLAIRAESARQEHTPLQRMPVWTIAFGIFWGLAFFSIAAALAAFVWGVLRGTGLL